MSFHRPQEASTILPKFQKSHEIKKTLVKVFVCVCVCVGGIRPTRRSLDPPMAVHILKIFTRDIHRELRSGGIPNLPGGHEPQKGVRQPII